MSMCWKRTRAAEDRRRRSRPAADRARSAIICFGLPPKISSPKPIEEIGQPEGRHEQDDVGLVDQRPQHQALDGDREHEHHADGEHERDERRHALLVQADERQRGEHHHDALREIEHAGGLEDQHEAERDQRIEHAGDERRPTASAIEQIAAPSSHRCSERVDRRPLIRAMRPSAVRSSVRHAEIGVDHAPGRA